MIYFSVVLLLFWNILKSEWGKFGGAGMGGGGGDVEGVLCNQW